MTPLHICFFGDSLTLGTGDPQFLGWPARLAQRALGSHGVELTVCNLGVRGNRSSDILARLADEAPRRWPADGDGRLVVSFGTADSIARGGYPRVDALTSMTNTRILLEQIKALGRPALFVGPPPVRTPDHNARIMAQTMMYGRIAAEAGVPFLDAHAPLAADEGYLADSADGIHPGAGGYDRLAALVEGWEAWQGWLDEARA